MDQPENRRETGESEHLREIGKETQFKPGVSGNPGGRPRRLVLTDALREILEDPKEANAVARMLVDQAKKGSRQHFQELADRVEGKPMQRIEVSGADGGAIPVAFADLNKRIEELLERGEDRTSAAGGEDGTPAAPDAAGTTKRKKRTP